VIDSHCHLDNSRFDEDREAAVERALAAGVTRMVAIGTGEGPPDLEAGVRLAERYDVMLATVGVHPHDAAKADGAVWARLPELLRHPKVIALGEIGLDYHYNFAPPDVQRGVFASQMAIAREANAPIVIHTREAWDDTFAMLEEHWRPTGLTGIFHCFSGGPAELARAVDLGFYISFSGVVTYPKAVELHQAARLAPADRILIETDAPFLAPAPHRGKRNEPAFLALTLARLAELRNVPVSHLARLTTDNFERFASLLHPGVH